VTVNGSGLNDPIAVKFGQVAARIIQPVSDTELTVTSPPAAPGTVQPPATRGRST